MPLRVNSTDDVANTSALLRGVWGLYCVMDMLGTSLSIILIYSASKAPVPTSADILTAGICFVYACSSLICGILKAASVASGRIIGCDVEATVAAITMASHFQIAGLIGIRTLLVVVFEKKKISNTPVCAAMLCMCMAAIVGTAVASDLRGDPMGESTYCFFRFDSAVVILWLASLFVLSVATLCIVHVWAVFHAWRTRNGVRAIVMGLPAHGGRRALASHDSGTISVVVRRSSWLVLTLVIWWGALVVIPIMVFSGMLIPVEVEMAFGGAMSFCNIVVPITYGMFSPYQKRTLMHIIRCKLCRRGRNGACVWTVAGSGRWTAEGDTVIEPPSARTIHPSPRFSSRSSDTIRSPSGTPPRVMPRPPTPRPKLPP